MRSSVAARLTAALAVIAPSVILAYPSAPPRSWSVTGLLPQGEVDIHSMAPVDVRRLLAEDDANLDRKDIPLRVGFPMKTDLSTSNSGTWETLPSGDRIWRLRIHSRDALWIVLGFGTFRMQPGGELYVYDPAGRVTLGPFTSDDIQPHGELWFPPIEGDTVIAEVFWPEALGEAEPNIHLGVVSHGYKVWGGIGARLSKASDAIERGACEIDVNCPLGANWQNEKRAVVNLLSGGSGYCTGSLITTTDGDCKNYVLTAHHCLGTQAAASSTTFQFNFEKPACNSGTAPTNQLVTGSTLRATYTSSDFTLLEMNTAPPDSYNVFYGGWSRTTSPATESTCIHHPNNDEKSISFNDDALTNGITWGASHWRVDNWEQAATEPGSSGSPLYDQNRRVVGQLHGGSSSCTSHTYDEYGKFDVSWTGGGTATSRLRDWLDAGNKGNVTTDGIDYFACKTPQPRLAYESHIVDDGQGNGDGIVDSGETFVLEANVENTGTLGATVVGGTLSTTKPLVTLSDDQSSWPNIPQAQVILSSAPHFTVSLDPTFRCGDVIAFHLVLTASESPGSWVSDFQVPTGTGSVSTVFSDTMESGANGWTQQTIEGTNAWSQTTASYASPTHSWKIADPSTRSDAVLRMPAVANLPANSLLKFKHRYNSEGGWDGGVLEYSTNGTSWQDAGPLITFGVYNDGISSNAASNLAGRSAWTGDSTTWGDVEVDLSTLAGQTLYLRWRFASDSSVADEGWYVDDVRIESTTYTCTTPVTRPGEVSPFGAAPLTIKEDPGGFVLKWSAPIAGGAPTRYKLYRSALPGPFGPVCEADLGTGTSIVLPALTSDGGFVVVALNDAGEGSYGQDSSGAERPPATGGAVCP